MPKNDADKIQPEREHKSERTHTHTMSMSVHYFWSNWNYWFDKALFKTACHGCCGQEPGGDTTHSAVGGGV